MDVIYIHAQMKDKALQRCERHTGLQICEKKQNQENVKEVGLQRKTFAIGYVQCNISTALLFHFYKPARPLKVLYHDFLSMN